MKCELYLISIYLVLNTKSVVKTVTREIIVQEITKKILQRQFLKYKLTRSLGNELLEGEIQEVNLYTNNYRCRSISKYSYSHNWKSGSKSLRSFRSWSMTESFSFTESKKPTIKEIQFENHLRSDLISDLIISRNRKHCN